MNSDISKVKPMSFAPITSSKLLKKELVEDDKADKLSQEKTEKKNSGSKVISLDDAKKLAKEGNKILENIQRNLQFKVDDTTKQVVMMIVDKESGETIRQVPSEEALALAQRMLKADGDPGGIVEDRV